MNMVNKANGNLRRRISQLPSISTLRLLLKFFKAKDPSKWYDFEIRSIIDFPELPGLLSIVRIFITFGIFIRFLYHQENYISNNRWLIPLQIFIFGLVTLNAIAFELLPTYRSLVTKEKKWIRFQIGVDILLITLSYLGTYTIESDFYLFYLLPILFFCQYLDFYENFSWLLLISLFYLISIILLILKTSNYDSIIGNLIRVYSLRIFSLWVVGFVTSFYRQVQIEINNKRKSISLIRQRISSILKITEFNCKSKIYKLIGIILAGITAQDGLGFERAIIFLKESESNLCKGYYGIGPINKAESISLWEKQINWEFENIIDVQTKELKYQSKKLNHALKNTIIPSTTFDFMKDKTFIAKEWVKVNISKCNILKEVLEPFESNWFVITPIVISGNIYGFLIVDNIATDKYIPKIGLDDLVLFADLIEDAIESYNSITGHVYFEKRKALLESFTSIANEIRSPLTDLKLNMQILEKRCQLNDNEPMLKKVLYNINRIENLISKSLEYGKSTEIKDREYVKVVDLINEVIREDYISSQLVKNNIGIKFQSDEIIDKIFVFVESQEFKKAIKNIIQNSIDALESIEFDREILIKIQEINEIVQISISDNGPGISEKDFPILSKIFEPFGTTKELTDKGGVGMGLSIADSIIVANEGTIRALNNDIGAEFIISLPKAYYQNSIGEDDD